MTDVERELESEHWKWLEVLAKVDRQLARECVEGEWDDEGWSAL